MTPELLTSPVHPERTDVLGMFPKQAGTLFLILHIDPHERVAACFCSQAVVGPAPPPSDIDRRPPTTGGFAAVHQQRSSDRVLRDFPGLTPVTVGLPLGVKGLHRAHVQTCLRSIFRLAVLSASIKKPTMQTRVALFLTAAPNKGELLSAWLPRLLWNGCVREAMRDIVCPCLVTQVDM